MVNVVLLLVMLSIGVIVVMCLDFQWPRPFWGTTADGLPVVGM
ncbi:hypothetical protein ACFVX3_32945 [Rhodococcus erythropolis]